MNFREDRKETIMTMRKVIFKVAGCKYYSREGCNYVTFLYVRRKLKLCGKTRKCCFFCGREICLARTGCPMFGGSVNKNTTSDGSSGGE